MRGIPAFCNHRLLTQSMYRLQAVYLITLSTAIIYNKYEDTEDTDLRVNVWYLYL